jgi:hypothetical protein
VVDRYADFKKYKLLILPDVIRLDDDLASILESYLRPEFVNSPFVVYTPPHRVRATSGRSLGQVFDSYCNALAQSRPDQRRSGDFPKTAVKIEPSKSIISATVGEAGGSGSYKSREEPNPYRPSPAAHFLGLVMAPMAAMSLLSITVNSTLGTQSRARDYVPLLPLAHYGATRGAIAVVLPSVTP